MSAARDDDKMIVQFTAAELRKLVRAEVDAAMVANANAGAAKSSRWVDITAASEHFDVSPATIRTWIHQGAPATQVGSEARPLYRISLDAFEAWVRSRESRRVAENNGVKR